MKAIEQYRRHGLSQPIRLKAGLAFRLFFWWGGGFLMLGAVLMMVEGTPFEQLLGLFGFLFFGFCFSIMLVAWVRGRRRGLVEVSRDGLYLSHLGIVLPWQDIGPAWVHTVYQKGIALKDVTFVLDNASRHRDRMDGLGRLLFRISRAVSGSRKGGAVEWGVRATMMAFDAGTGMHRQMNEALEMMRQAVLEKPDAIVFNVPMVLRFGVSAEDMLAIINAETLAQRGAEVGLGEPTDPAGPATDLSD